MLKSKLFYHGFTVFDVVRVNDKWWVAMGMVGQRNACLVGGMVTRMEPSLLFTTDSRHIYTNRAVGGWT